MFFGVILMRARPLRLTAGLGTMVTIRAVVFFVNIDARKFAIDKLVLPS
jgi:hypothetical protein